MPENHAMRRAALADHLQQHGHDAALITRLVNVQYLTGLDSSNAAVLVRADGSAVLATDGRYATAAAEAAPDVELLRARGVAAALLTQGDAGTRRKVALEAHDITLAGYENLTAEIEKAGYRVETVHLGRVVEDIRAVKDESEIDRLTQACAISCRALEDLYEAGGLLGRTEQTIARDLEWRMFELGADGLAFETIVAAGPNSAIPHHSPGARVVAAGDLLKIDFGATYRGYHADCTRTVVVGATPAEWQQEIYELVAQAQHRGTQALLAGADCLSVDTAAREHIVAAGHGEAFSHGTGHGVGLEIHEAPTLGYSATGRLADRMTATVEPGVYLPGRGGVRIEDTLVVRDSAQAEVLTPTTKSLQVIDA